MKTVVCPKIFRVKDGKTSSLRNSLANEVKIKIDINDKGIMAFSTHPFYIKRVNSKFYSYWRDNKN